MPLCYRKTTYQAKTNPVNTVKLGINARFLGKTYSIHSANPPNDQQLIPDSSL